MTGEEHIHAQTHDVFALGSHVFAQQASDAGAQLAVPQQIAKGVRGGDADSLTVVTTQVIPGAWALGSKSSVSTGLHQLTVPLRQ
mgnify:CR=1 FL=1